MVIQGGNRKEALGTESGLQAIRAIYPCQSEPPKGRQDLSGLRITRRRASGGDI